MKRSLVLTIVILSVLTATCVAGRQHDKRLWTDADRIRHGMSASQAKQILGEPSWVGECGAKFPYGWAKTCVAELGYRAAFAPFPPTYFIVQLDDRSRVISADTITSP
jgi:hypothetical protein